jgi:hypothetical protein
LCPMDSVTRYLVGLTVDLPKGKTTTRHQVGCPIRRFLDQSLFPAPQDLSQGIASFIASCCQGIHQTPFSRLIRSRDGQGCRAATRNSRGALLRRAPPGPTRACPRRAPGRKSYISRPHPGKDGGLWLVYLTWNKAARGPAIRRSPATPPLGRASGSDVSLSSRLSNDRPDRTGQRGARAVRSDPWWSLAGSNRRPSACKADALPAELRPRGLGGGGSRRTRTSDLTLIRRAL